MSEPPVSDPIPAAPTRRRWWRRLIAGFVVVAAAVAGWCLYVDYAWDRELREAIADADRGDPGWRLRDIEEKRPNLGNEENSAVQIARALKARPAKWFIWYQPPNTAGADVVLSDPQGFSSRLDEVPPQVRLDPEQERVLRAELTRGATVIAEARKLTDFPHGRNPITWRKDYVSSLLPWTQDSRDVVNLLRHDVLLRCQDGDLDGALRSSRASFNASLALRDEPFLVSQLVRIACRKVTLNDLERILAQGGPPGVALADFQRLLAEDEKENLFLAAVRGERGMLDGFMEVVQHREVTPTQLRQAVSGLSNKSPGATWLGPDLDVYALYATARHERAQVLRRMNRMAEIAQLPPEEQGRAVDVWEADTAEATPLARRFMPAVKKVNSASRRSCAEMRCMTVLLALERYRRDNGGRWPDRLDELTPRYLDRVPLDPFDGRPIKYARRDDGVTVYSVGPDGEDDGGNLNGKWLDKGSDWGFRLWDVARRGQPPDRPAN